MGPSKEAAIRLLLFMLAIGIACVGIGNRAEAQNYPWCAQYSVGDENGLNCGFISFGQCMATVRGVGGFCILNNTYQPPLGPHPAMSVQRRHPY
jgi:Protein of unknown function (DUF3551)